MLKGFYFILFGIFVSVSLDPRPGMGDSYRSSSSSSSSSSYRSSSSSYSKSSSSSNTKSGYSSSSYSSPSTPSLYFNTKDHKIGIHLQSDGSALVQESFTVLAKQSNLGIRRPQFFHQENWQVTDIKVSPEKFNFSHNYDSIDIYWDEAKDNPETKIALEYKILQTVQWFGTLPLVHWRFPKTSNDSPPFSLDITWDPGTISPNLQLYEERIDTTLGEYVKEPAVTEKSSHSIHFSPNNKTKEINSIVFIDLPTLDAKFNLNLSKTKKTTIDSLNNSYRLKEKVILKNNGSQHYQSEIEIPLQYLNSDPLHIAFGLFQFRQFGEFDWNQMVTPSYQITYGLEGLENSFWHLFSASLIKFQENLNTKSKTFSFAYSTLGETSNRKNKGTEHWIRITGLEKNNNLDMESFQMQVESESPINKENARVELVIQDCEFCTSYEDQNTILIPIQPEWTNSGFLFQWNAVVPANYNLYLRVREPNKSFFYNPLLVSYAVLNAFYHSPGSGSHSAYLIVIGLLSSSFLIIGFFFISKANRKRKYNTKLNSILKKIQIADPDFDWEEFSKKVTHIAEQTVLAWDKGNMEPVRNYLSAAVFQRFSIQLRLLREIDKETNRMKNFSVLSVEILDLELESEYQTIHLKLRCRSKDQIFPTDTKEEKIQKELHSSSTKTYEEVHSFTRKLSATTKPKVDLVHNHCPACGANSPRSHKSTKCQYCGVIFNSGESDWVLTEITQTVEWESTSIEKLQSITNGNGISKQILEDRASAVFWKYIQFQSLPHSLVLSRESTERAMQSLGESGRSPLFLPVIGSCKVIQWNLESSPQTIVCEIRWSASTRKNLIPEHRRNQIKLSLSVNRSANLGFSEMSCQNCGAAFPELDATHCEFCNKEIPKKVDDWLLEEISPI
ncbi:TIM44-like domain-containing protein [Leptospira sp. 201903075]|uniref:TIM44-like domain-containing protein n=1 Tax=Leptospira chreensis TaxID=2810035 RepID=UPI001963C88B|nr:TIM44-like domain-containing protein [Leptospira chreensis]MBM9591757.1 TIM44-like domain-containing protein [Leptospira chreensis]